MIYDYIIVGSGPAGATAAYCLQNKGANCLVIDKNNSINEKTCGGLLTWSGISALEKIGLNTKELFELGGTQIKQFVYTEKNNTTIIHKYHSGEYGLGITRNLLDQWLLDYAVSFGADLKFGVKLKKIIKKENLFSVGNDFSNNLIIATGARGFVPQDMYIKKCNQTFGLSIQIKGNTSLQPNSVFFFMIKEDNPDYFWIIPNGNNIWNIGIWFKKAPKDAVEQFWKYKKEFVDRYFDDILYIRKLRGAFCGNVDLSKQLPKKCYGIGDFAGVNQYNTGEGLRQSIESAIILSKQI